MPEPWHGINDPGYFFKPKPESADNTRVAYKTDPVADPKKEPPPTEVKLSEGKFLPPDGGLKFNDKCKVQVKVEYLRETTLKKITFSLFCTYNGKTEQMKPDKEGFEKDGIAEAEFDLFYPEDYKQGDKADFYFKASHRRGEKIIESEKLTVPISSGKIGKKDIKATCEKHWEAHKADCSGFVKAVATDLNVTLTGQANDIVDQIQKSPWKVLKDGKEADSEARAGKFVVAGLKDDPNGHVVIIVPGELAHEKYPTGYWGHLGSVGYKNTTINYSWNSAERDKVIYASIQIEE
jgi:hypothetical protein